MTNTYSNPSKITVNALTTKPWLLASLQNEKKTHFFSFHTAIGCPFNVTHSPIIGWNVPVCTDGFLLTALTNFGWMSFLIHQWLICVAAGLIL